MDWQTLRARYMRDEWPRRLGNLASTLGRIAQRANNPGSSEAAALALREAMWLIEWNLHDTPQEILAELAPMQSELSLWWRGWNTVAQSPDLRRLLTRRTRDMSDRVLELSGLLKQPAT